MSRALDGDAHTVARAATWSLAGQLYQIAMSLISGLLIARLIGPASYGVFNLIRTLCESVNLLTKAGFDVAIIRFLGERRDDLRAGETIYVCRRVVSTVFGLGLVPVVLGVAGVATFLERHVYKFDGFALALIAMTVAIPFMSTTQVLGGIFRGYLRVAPRVVAELFVQPTLRVVIFLIVFALGWRLWAVIVGTVASFILAAGLLFVWGSRGILKDAGVARTIESRKVWDHVRSIGRYSVVISATGITAAILGRADLILLGALGDAEGLGQYSVAQMVAGLLAIFNLALSQAAAPLIASMGRKHAIGEMRALLHQHARWVLMTTLPAFFAMVLYERPFLSVLGTDFVSDQPILLLLALSQLITAVFASAGFTLSMTGRHVAELRFMSFGAVTNVVLAVLLIPPFGLLGAALATLIGTLLGTSLRALYVFKDLGIFPIGKDVCIPVIICCVCFVGTYGLCVVLADPVKMSAALASSAISGLLYVLLLARFGLCEGDRNVLRSLLSGSIGRSRGGR